MRENLKRNIRINHAGLVVGAASAVGVCHDRAVASHQAAGVHIQLSEEKEQIVRCALILFTDLKRHTRGEREKVQAADLAPRA